MTDTSFSFAQLQSNSDPDDYEAPSYSLPFRVADNHSIGNSGLSWTDPAAWQQKIGNMGRFIAVSALSGINSFYNTGVAVGRFAGFTNVDDRNTADWITSFDTNLADYYSQNKEWADVAGFVLGSIAPGIGGIKILNAGQVAMQTAINNGRIGGTTAKALGLLIPKTDDFLLAAQADIRASTTSLQLINSNSTRALASGFYQNVLEAAAFETMVQATMFKSPILEAQDGWDIVKNIAIGGAVGGTIVGIGSAAKLRGTLKKTVFDEDNLRMPFQQRPGFSVTTSSSSRIVQLSFDAEAAAIPVAIKNSDGVIVNNFDVTSRLYQAKLTSNFNDIRAATNNLAGKKDSELGNVIANFLTPVRKNTLPVPGFAQQTYESMNGAISLMRAAETHPLELAMSKAMKEGKVPDKIVAARYVKLFGDDAGSVFETAPSYLSYADRYIGEEAIIRAVRSDYKFSSKFEGAVNRWSAIKLKGAFAGREAEARYIWASKMLQKIPDNAIIDKYDIPVLTRAYQQNILGFKIASGDGPSLELLAVNTREQLYNILKEAKQETANHFSDSFRTPKGKIKKGDGLIPKQDALDTIARITDVRKSYLDGQMDSVEINDLFATATAQRNYRQQLVDRDLSTSQSEAVQSVVLLPKYGRIVYDLDPVIVAADQNVLNGIVHYKEQQKLFVQTAKNVFARIIGKNSVQFPDILPDKLAQISRNDSAAGLLSSDSSSYGSVASDVSFIGSIVRQIKQDFRKASSDAMESQLVRLGSKQEAALEFEASNQFIARAGKLFIIREDTLGETVFVDRALVKRTKNGIEESDDIVDYELLEEGVNSFRFKHQETLDMWKAHIEESGKRTQSFREIHAAQGKTDFKDSEVARPIRPDLKQFPHFAFVIDPRVTGSGHVTMIHAASEKELQQLADKVPAAFKVLYKTESESFYKARGDYEYARTLNENYINAELSNNGVFSNFFPKSDPQKIIDDILGQHYRESDTLVSESVRLRYEPEFSIFEDLGKQYSKADTSKLASKSDLIEQSAKNPYFNLIKTALDLSKINEHTLIYDANKHLDSAFSRVVGAVKDAFSKINSPEELDTINGILDTFGMKPAYYDAALQALVNHTAPRGELTKFVRSANAILSRFTLGLDPLNSLNNAIGSNVLRTTELVSLTRAIKEGNTALASDLSKLAKIKLPGTESEILSPSKLIANAISTFWKDGGATPGRTGPVMQKYRDMQLVKDRAEQLKLLVEDFTLKGTETVAELDKRVKTGFARAKELASETLDKGEKLTGNILAEEFNRFVSANVMDQITSIAIRHGLMDDKTARTYINTFVNRVEGNIVASQRPLIFQGPIGQAISLFQSYQFNLIQQLLRYTAEGTGKDLAMLAGMQSTLYGMQSLPGFQAINVHIIGQMSGNSQHKDTYDAVYGTVGRTAGDFILYGIPSRLIDTNIYSRGDINPRHLTILPTSLQETPIVAGWAKFFGSMYETTKKVAGGAAVWESILQGVEHNGISRPLAGMAQTLQAFGPLGQAYSTSSKGSILYQNDLASLATLTRLAGGRPLDEALINDAMFRVKSYDAARKNSLKTLAERIKSTLIQGNQPTDDQISNFAEKYVELGGRQKNFNKYMMEMYKSANTSQAEQLSTSLSNPYVYKLQLLMGGSDD